MELNLNQTSNPVDSGVDKTKLKTVVKYLSGLFIASLVVFGGAFYASNGLPGDSIQASLFNANNVRLGFYDSTDSTSHVFDLKNDTNTALETNFRIKETGYDTQNAIHGLSAELKINIKSPRDMDSTRSNIEKFLDLNSIKVENTSTVMTESNAGKTWPGTGSLQVLKMAMVDATTGSTDGKILPNEDLARMTLNIKPNAPVGEIEFILNTGEITSDPSLGGVTTAGLTSHQVLSLKIVSTSTGGGGSSGNGSGGGAYVPPRDLPGVPTEPTTVPKTEEPKEVTHQLETPKTPAPAPSPVPKLPASGPETTLIISLIIALALTVGIVKKAELA